MNELGFHVRPLPILAWLVGLGKRSAQQEVYGHAGHPQHCHNHHAYPPRKKQNTLKGAAAGLACIPPRAIKTRPSTKQRAPTYELTEAPEQISRPPRSDLQP